MDLGYVFFELNVFSSFFVYLAGVGDLQVVQFIALLRKIVLDFAFAGVGLLDFVPAESELLGEFGYLLVQILVFFY